MQFKILYRVLAMLVLSTVASAAISGYDVMKIVYDEANKNKNQLIDMKLIIVNKDKEKRTRLFHLKSKIAGSNTKSLIKFYEPAQIKGTTLLTHKNNSTSDTSQWIYFPSFRSIKAISGDEKNQSFMGSDFSYSDIAGRQLNQDEHTLVKEDDNYYYVTSVPKDKSDSYSKMDIIVSKKNKVALKIVFYNKSGEILKTLLNSQVSLVNGAYEVVKSVMKNELRGGESMMEKLNINTSVNIKDDDVNLKALQLAS